MCSSLKLWLVTTGAKAAVEGDRVENLSGSLWTLTKCVINVRMPSLTYHTPFQVLTHIKTHAEHYLSSFLVLLARAGMPPSGLGDHDGPAVRSLPFLAARRCSV
jgi:hypothetical protein